MNQSMTIPKLLRCELVRGQGTGSAASVAIAQTVPTIEEAVSNKNGCWNVELFTQCFYLPQVQFPPAI